MEGKNFTRYIQGSESVYWPVIFSFCIIMILFIAIYSVYNVFNNPKKPLVLSTVEYDAINRSIAAGDNINSNESIKKINYNEIEDYSVLSQCPINQCVLGIDTGKIRGNDRIETLSSQSRRNIPSNRRIFNSVNR